MQQAIYNEGPVPPELQRYLYRREFGLSAAELDDEPADQFFMNLKIYAYMKDKERLESKHGSG